MSRPPLHIEGLSLFVTSYNGAPPSCEPGSALCANKQIKMPYDPISELPLALVLINVSSLLYF